MTIDDPSERDRRIDEVVARFHMNLDVARGLMQELATLVREEEASRGDASGSA